MPHVTISDYGWTVDLLIDMSIVWLAENLQLLLMSICNLMKLDELPFRAWLSHLYYNPNLAPRYYLGVVFKAVTSTLSPLFIEG